MILLNILIIENGWLLSLDAILVTFSLSTGTDKTENIVPRSISSAKKKKTIKTYNK